MVYLNFLHTLLWKKPDVSQFSTYLAVDKNDVSQFSTYIYLNFLHTFRRLWKTFYPALLFSEISYYYVLKNAYASDNDSMLRLKYRRTKFPVSSIFCFAVTQSFFDFSNQLLSSSSTKSERFLSGSSIRVFFIRR